MEAVSAVASIALSAVVAAATAFMVIGKYKEKVDQLEKKSEKLEGKCDKMRSDLDHLDEFKTSTQKFIDSKLYGPGSPLNLSDFGKQLITESGFTNIFPTVRDDLVSRLEQFGPTSQYDVQEKARSLMDGLVDDPRFAAMKTYAYESGNDMGQILRAGAIPLRDYYFEKHPEIVNPNETY